MDHHTVSAENEVWKRVRFLRDILSDLPPGGLEPVGTGYPWQRLAAAQAGDHLLIYFGEHRPREWWIGLRPIELRHQVDLIDPWNMTITPLETAPGPAADLFGKPIDPMLGMSVQLPGDPYLAIRVRPTENRSPLGHATG